MASQTSPLPPLARRDQTITERVFEGLDAGPDRAALIDGPSGTSLTAAALKTPIQHLAGGLAAMGVGPGRVLAIFAPNMPDHAVMFHAAAYTGATPTTVNPTYTAHELAHQLTDSGASWLFTLTALMPVAHEAITGPGPIKVVAIDGGLEDLMGAPLTAQVPVDLDRHVVVLPYSSGTTGLPKGVRLSHRNLVAFIVPQAGVEPDLAVIQGILAERLAKFKRPREIRLVQTIPKSASGKILRRVLKAQVLAG